MGMSENGSGTTSAARDKLTQMNGSGLSPAVGELANLPCGSTGLQLYYICIVVEFIG